MSHSASVRVLPVAALLMLSAPARADDVVETCTKAAQQGQQLRDQGKLRAARASFGACVQPQCPGPVRKDCSEWFAEVDRRVPTVILRAVRADGSDAAPTSALLDGEPVSLDGRRVPVDPGRHVFEVEIPGGKRTTSFQAVESEQSRFVTLAVDDLEPSRGRSRARVAYGLYGLSGVALITAGVTGYIGMRDWVDLQSECRPRCAAADINAAKTKFLVADVALGVSLLSAAAATVLLLTEPKTAANAAWTPELRF